MYLVIGATEMVGAHLTCTMLKQGLRVRCTKRKGDDILITKHYLSFYSNDYENLFSEIEWVDADSSDLESMLDAMEGIDVAFCCERPYLNSKHHFNDNIDEMRNILVAVQDAEVEYFYYLSSFEALGEEADCKEITETSERNPKGDYPVMSQLAYLCEMEVQRALNEGVKGGIVNPTVVIGPGDWKKDTSRIFTYALLKSYYTKGVTGFVGVNDVVKCLMSMAKKRITGEKFILCSQCISYYQLLKYIADSFGIKPPNKYANGFRLMIGKIMVFFKSLFIGRRPFIDDEFLNRLVSFKLYSNTKSMGRIIVDYEPIDQVVDEVCAIYLKDNPEKQKKIYKFA